MKKAVVIHSGGMDSSICLALAVRDFGKENVVSLSFSYEQRHSNELIQAAKICKDWGVDHHIISLQDLGKVNALTDKSLEIEHLENQTPNTLVTGRNGLMARLGAIYANRLGANIIYMGVMELEVANSGYRDCSRKYMDLKQEILRLDLNDPEFEIRTPLIEMTKEQTMAIADQLGLLDYLITHTITCYEGVPHPGCEKCPSCKLRNNGLKNYLSFR